MYKTHTEVTKEPCIAENREPPKTPATPSIWNGCIKNKVGSKKKSPLQTWLETFETPCSIPNQ
jgi:hypothetical protein